MEGSEITLKPFKYFNAETVEQAVEFLREYQERARVISGGTDLIPALKNDIFPEYPEAIINIKNIRDLNYIRETSEGLKIGALVKLDEIVKSSIVRDRYRILAEAAESVGSPQIRRMGTIGGNLCQDIRCWYYRYPHHIGGHISCLLKGGKKCYAVTGDNRYHSVFGHYRGCVAVNPSDTGVALLALDAEVKIVGPDGAKIKGMEDFFKSPNRNLATEEILAEIHIPRVSRTTRQKFLKFRLRSSIEFSIASVGIVTDMIDGVCKDSRIVLGSAAPVPIRAKSSEKMLKDSIIDEEIAEKVAEASVSGAKPLNMNSYKIKIIKTLVKRAVLSLR